MKTITKFAAAALLALSAVAPALATEPEAQLLVERNTYMPAMGHAQAYRAHAEVAGSSVIAIDPAAQLLAERGGVYQDPAFNARAQADAGRQ